MSGVVGPDGLPLPDLIREAVERDGAPSARIVAVESYRPGYLPYPARVTLEKTDGTRTTCVLKVGTAIDRIAHEARVLRALTDLGRPVPEVLAGPLAVESQGQQYAVLIMSELPGQPLPWLGLTDLDTANRTGCLVQEAVDALHAATEQVRAHPIGDLLPCVTLESELQEINATRGPWSDVPLFREAVDLLKVALPLLATPLVFSNGDYNPLNFLHDGQSITGWLDFEAARFEDPYIGFAKFLLWSDDEYGWGAGAKVGLVERYLYARNVAPSAFLPRLVLRGLTHLSGHSPEKPPHHLLDVIANAVHRLTLLYTR
ncbi:MAG TPA: phosphotransferase [Chloroflexota bacterium]|nr:phosphotransferase [Chloroflexota bacterium]